MQFMSRVASLIEVSLIHSADPELSARRREFILGLRNPAKRFGALAIHNFTVSHPKAATRLINRDLAALGLGYAGVGSHSIVYRKESDVIKVDMRSIDYTEPKRQETADRYNAEHSHVAKHLPAFVLAQSVLVAPHPAKDTLRAVQIVQPYRQIHDLKLFPSREAVVDEQALETACETFPGVENALGEFVNGSREMYANTRLLPDTFGRSNLVIATDTTSELVLIDGQPVSCAKRATQATILNQLDSLEQALADVA